MKSILLLTTIVVLKISCYVSFIWAIIEFILYLAKDEVFNWWSVWIFLITTIGLIAIAILSAKRLLDEPRAKKSTFQERLEKLKNERP